MDYHHLPPTRTKTSSGMDHPPSPKALKGLFYPKKLTYVLSGLKIIFGSGLVVMGALALYHKAGFIFVQYLRGFLGQFFIWRFLFFTP